MKTFKMKMLAGSVAAMMLTSLTAQASEKKIGDLSIYQAADQGAATITMMLDTSGSMGVVSSYDSIYEDYKVSCGSYYKAYQETTDLIDAQGNKLDTISYTLNGCDVQYDQNTIIRRYDRISRLKQALIELFADGTLLSSSFKIGIGNYSANGDSKSGQILVPAKPLTVEHRKQLIKKISSLSAQGGTPSAHAYAEAGAYMMGTKTSEVVYDTRYITKGYIDYTNGRYFLYKCTSNFSVPENKRYRCYSTQLVQYSYDKNSLDTRLIGDYNHESAGSGKTKLVFSDKTTGWWANDSYSGAGYSDPSTQDETTGDYISPISSGQCDGYGVFFLTDGAPNGVYGSSAANLMEKSLETTGIFRVNGDDCTGSTLSSTSIQNSGGGGWKCMAQYSKKLRDPSNPANVPIKTAAVGFGSVFNPAGGLAMRDILVPQPDGSVKEKKIIDCSKITSTDGKNLCLLSESAGFDKETGVATGQYGQGGFTATSDPQVLKQSVIDFAASLVQVINTSPSGSITVPTDPLSTTNVQPFAYLPMLEPKVGDANVIWPGNLKKYAVNDGTLYGERGNRLYVTPEDTVDGKTNNFPFALNPQARDLWMKGLPDTITSGNLANNSIKAGGVYARLKAPDSSTPYSVRNVRVEDIDSAGKPRLVKVGVSSSGDLVGFDTLLDPVYTPVAKAYLLNYLGYSGVSTDPATYAGLNNVQVLRRLKDQLQPISSETKVLGGVIHSKPELVSYSGKFNAEDKDTINNATGASGGDGITDEDAGQISNEESDREDFVMFGSMDGALHLVDAEDGEEEVAVIPLSTIKSQLKALKEGATGGGIGTPKFGVDAPWASKAKYEVNLSGNGSIDAKEVRAYGGLRMGGVGFYGLDISNSDRPEMLFSIKRGATSSEGFMRLGQTWSKPLVTKIKTGPNPDDTQEVVIFSGGYDMCYESPTFALKSSGSVSTDDCSNKKMAYGNAIYMLDARTGERLWTWSGANDASSKSTTVAGMEHSVVGEVTGLDRNDNGSIDHIYFADLGGKVFRIDLQEGRAVGTMTKRVVELFDANEGITASDHVPFRFYARPIVSLYDNSAGERFATVSIASGDRSSPLANRDVDDANRVYGIFDRDVAQQGLYGTIELISTELDTDDLTALPISSDADRTTFVNAMQTPTLDATLNRKVYTSQGWYYPLTRFDGYGNVRDVKSMGEGMVIGGFYYMTAYNPNMSYGTPSDCSAKVTGGSERQLYCLPYGICNQQDDDGNYLSQSGAGGFTRAGPGIQELALAPMSANQRNVKVLLGNQTFTELMDTDSRTNDGEGGDPNDINRIEQLGADGTSDLDPLKGYGSSPLPVFKEGYKMLVQRWYELQNAD